MPLNKNAYLRLKIINDCLLNKRNTFPTRAFLVEKMEEKMGIKMSLSSVDKDIRLMKEQFNAPIVFDRNRKGYYYADSNYSFDVPITEEQLYVIDFAKATMRIFGNAGLQEQFSSFTGLLKAGEKDELQDEDAAHTYIQMDSIMQADGLKWLYMLYTSIIQSKTVVFDYSPFEREIKTRTVSPYLLKESAGRWYVVGYEHSKKSTLVFALDRIINLKHSKEKYLIDKKFSKKDYFKYSLGVFHSWEHPPQKVVLRFDKKLAPYLLSMPLHRSQKVLETNENILTLEIEVYVTGNYELLRLILGYGSSVEVVSPESLITIVVEETKKLFTHYLKK